MRRITAAILAVLLIFTVSGCKKKGKGDEGDTIVVLEDNTDISLAISGIDTLNPLETKSKSVQSIMNIVYEPLFELDEKINAVPVLAKSYKLSEDGRQITVKLRSDVKWHDGTVFNAEDVIYTLSKLIYSDGLYKKTADKISSFTAISNDEIVINFVKEELDFAYKLTFPILSKNTRYAKDADFLPIGTGAYKFAEKTESEIVLEPNTLWYGEAVPQKKVLIKLLRDNLAVTQAFNVNETDAILSEEAEDTQDMPKSNSQSKEIVSSNMVFLGFNTENPGFSPEVRRAIELLLDKQKILEKNAYGYGRTSDTSINPNSWAYESAGLDAYSQDYVAKLLDNAGYELKDGVYSNGQYTMEFEILVNSDNEQRMAIAETVSEMLSGAGFAVTVKTVGYNSYLSRISSGEFEMFIGETETDSVINPLAMLDNGKNYFGFDATELMVLQSNLYGETNQENYRKTVKTITRKFAENPPYIPLFFTTRSVLYAANVSGITEPTLTDRYKNIEKWYFYSAKAEGEKTR